MNNYEMLNRMIQESKCPIAHDTEECNICGGTGFYQDTLVSLMVEKFFNPSDRDIERDFNISVSFDASAGMFTATVTEIPGLSDWAETEDEVKALIIDSIQATIKYYNERNERYPWCNSKTVDG